MTDTITASPLCWPPSRPRTPASERQHGRFGRRNSNSWGRSELTLAQARDRVIEQLGMFTRVGQKYRHDDLIISSDLKLRNDGLPRSGQHQPDDPGVAVYFQLDGRQWCIPCDNYLRIEDNLAAVAATLEALRTLERHGSAMFEAAFTGFTALPGPDQVVGRTWRDVLNYYGSDLAEAKRRYMQARKQAHPDHGGSTDQYHEVETAWQQAQEELKS
ncbi:hypothetical protein [Marinobacterium litorale]|uniref:hypothetical protein n=1 Tax=Marinobacterium litorale TaxID=404770 RepID=UPI000407EB93|nr:hypothetical protein [Marinobacterium litorale]